MVFSGVGSFKQVAYKVFSHKKGITAGKHTSNQAIILLNSLPESFKDVKAAIKYGRTSLSLEKCIFALKSKELELKIEKKDNGENLFVRGRQPVRNGNNSNPNFNKGKGRS